MMRRAAWRYPRIIPAGLVLAAICGWGGAAPAEGVWEETVRAAARTAAEPAAGTQRMTMIGELLSEGLTREEAVQIAVMNNAELRAAFAELGITEADLVQAGLYSNPSLDVLLRWPEHAGGNELEVELGFNLADLWRVPVRRDVARAELERATMMIAAEMLNTAADARRAQDHCVLLARLVEQAGEVLSAAQQWRDRVYLRAEYGYTSDLDKSMADAEVARWEMQQEMLAARLEIAKARLKRVLGLGPEQEVTPRGPLPAPPERPPDTEALVERALANRPDLRAMQAGVTAAERTLALERRSRWAHVSLGPAYAREPGGEELWGVLLDVELPVFDDNRAGRSRARHELYRSRDQLTAMESRAREEVTAAAEQLALAMRRERIIREKVLPAREKAHEWAMKYYHEMQLNMLYVLEAQRELFEAQSKHTAALGEIAETQVELEFVIGGTRGNN